MYKKIYHNLIYKKSTAKHIIVARMWFNKEYTKVDFGYDNTKINYIDIIDDRILINPDIYIETKNNIYQLISATTYKKAFFKQASDFRYFSLLFEPITEKIDFFDIIDKGKDKKLYKFGFTEIILHADK